MKITPKLFQNLTQVDAVAEAKLEAPKVDGDAKGIQGLAFLGGPARANDAPAAATLAALQGAAAGMPPSPADQIAKNDPNVKEVFMAPTSRTSTTVRFQMPGYGGKEIKPKERWLFEIPDDLRGANIRTVIVAHRKDDKYGASVDNGYDKQGAYNLVTAKKTGTDEWVTWSDEYGSKKFAEPRPAGDPENENLHDWLHSVGAQNVDVISMQNVGVGDLAVANVHFVEIEFFPAKASERIEKIFTPGTAFADPEKNITKPKYGGGMGSRQSTEQLQKHGLYPGALVLNGGAKDVGDGMFTDSSGRLHIKLPAGKMLGGLEVSVGDTQFDTSRPASEQRNKDGHYGSLGWAKLSARIVNNGVAGKPFMDRINVPPSGVLSGGPIESGYVIQPGDEIVVDASMRSYVMGVRVTLT